MSERNKQPNKVPTRCGWTRLGPFKLPNEGIALIAENVEDVCASRRLVDFERHPAEWVNRLNGGFLSALFVMNNSFTIALFLPAHIAPDAILKELED